jgi:hydroxymethylbilane synthase
VSDAVRIGTRASGLALRQSELVADGLRRRWPGLSVVLVPITTSGDRLAHADLSAMGGKGLFVREIEDALREGRVEIAVHSLKDLPAETPDGLVLTAFPPREDPRDALVSRTGARRLDDLPAGARVGTSSLRRRVELLARRPDLRVEAIRGNVDTRLRKLEAGAYDAVVLAAAGLRRLGLAAGSAAVLEPGEMLPAVGQGILAVETRAPDLAVRHLVAALDDGSARAAALAERAFLAAMGGSCNMPLAAYAREEGGAFRLDAFVATPTGDRVLRDGETGSRGDPEGLGRRLASRMLAGGADEIVRAARAA